MRKKGAVTPRYVSPNQLILPGFETPFTQQLTTENRWVKLSMKIPWDKVVAIYDKQFKSLEGRPPISGRVILGAVIIKHMLGLTDRETILQIQENMFLQYFLGYSSFTNEAPFSASLFVEIRERLSIELLHQINQVIVANSFEKEVTDPPLQNKETVPKNEDQKGEGQNLPSSATPTEDKVMEAKTLPTHHGKLLLDATVAPQLITFPTDLKLLNTAREKTEQLITKLYNKLVHDFDKPRTYKNIARKEYLNAAKKKSKTSKEIYKANGSQIRYVKRNLGHIALLISVYEKKNMEIPLKQKDKDYVQTIQLIYEQQHDMHSHKTKSVANRIVNLHQPHVRPIVRGKDGKKVEFGSKLQVALVNGFAFLDKLSWDNFNEGKELQHSVESYKKRMGYYPKEVLADRIYCTRANRQWLKEQGIELRAKPLGRPSATALSNQVSPGERNPIEGKFGQAKVGYGLAGISAKLKTTSESWIASILLVLNLVRLTGLNALEIILLLIYSKKLKLSF